MIYEFKKLQKNAKLRKFYQDIVAKGVVFCYHKSKMAARIQDGWWYNCDIQSNKAMQGIVGYSF